MNEPCDNFASNKKAKRATHAVLIAPMRAETVDAEAAVCLWVAMFEFKGLDLVGL